MEQRWSKTQWDPGLVAHILKRKMPMHFLGCICNRCSWPKKLAKKSKYAERGLWVSQKKDPKGKFHSSFSPNSHAHFPNSMLWINFIWRIYRYHYKYKYALENFCKIRFLLRFDTKNGGLLQHNSYLYHIKLRLLIGIFDVLVTEC